MQSLNKMTTLAEKYKNLFETNTSVIANISVEKYQNNENETTWYIFYDGSALGKNSFNKILIETNYRKKLTIC